MQFKEIVANLYVRDLNPFRIKIGLDSIEVITKKLFKTKFFNYMVFSKTSSLYNIELLNDFYKKHKLYEK